MSLTSYTIVRTFAVPSARLFRALVDPADLAAWSWGLDAKDVRANVDARPGGALEVTAASPTPGAARFSGFRGIYVDVVPDRRLVHTVHWDSDVGYNAPGSHPIDEAMVYAIDADPQGSRLSVSHHGIPDDGKSARAHENGVRATLADLETHLLRLR